jgi:hypothetical protein
MPSLAETLPAPPHATNTPHGQMTCLMAHDPETPTRQQDEEMQRMWSFLAAQLWMEANKTGNVRIT